ncbi:MAG: sugar phosphate isomerase/epimerase [Planctomycetota bacterium]|nr:MAG: sugar phosphate isomerase/epimerase [Planctomycetota bacterium]
MRPFEADDVLATIHKLQLPAVEFIDDHFSSKSSDADIEAMKSKTQALRIQMLGHGVNRFTADHEANRRWFEFAKKAGIKNISADPSEDAFDSLDELCEQYQIRIAIHNHGPGARYDKIADVLTAIEGRHPLIGACADLGHYIRSNEDPIRAIRLFEGRLYGIHLKDYDRRAADAEGVVIGQGHLDLAAAFAALKEVNFPADGCLSLEYEADRQRPLPGIEACLAAAEEAAGKVAG